MIEIYGKSERLFKSSKVICLQVYYLVTPLYHLNSLWYSPIRLTGSTDKNRIERQLDNPVQPLLNPTKSIQI